jgi:hypothetical protein
VYIEGQMQAIEQFAAVARGRGEDHETLHGTIVRELRETLRGGGALDWCG